MLILIRRVRSHFAPSSPQPIRRRSQSGRLSSLGCCSSFSSCQVTPQSQRIPWSSVPFWPLAPRVLCSSRSCTPPVSGFACALESLSVHGSPRRSFRITRGRQIGYVATPSTSHIWSQPTRIRVRFGFPWRGKPSRDQINVSHSCCGHGTTTLCMSCTLSEHDHRAQLPLNHQHRTGDVGGAGGLPANTACSRLAGLGAIFRVRMRYTSFQLGNRRASPPARG
jgi:hypothetical protein